MILDELIFQLQKHQRNGKGGTDVIIVDDLSIEDDVVGVNVTCNGFIEIKHN